MLDPIGFWSYARHDDTHSDGQLSQLRLVVGKAVGLQHGADVSLWQDIAAIPYGADWADTIERTIGNTTFFMPIVTPRFLKSVHCRDEYASFRRRMQALSRNDLVFPIHLVDVESLDVGETVFGDELSVLRKHQWIDFRPLLYADPRSPEVRRWAGDLAAAIIQAHRRRITPPVREDPARTANDLAAGVVPPTRPPEPVATLAFADLRADPDKLELASVFDRLASAALMPIGAGIASGIGSGTFTLPQLLAFDPMKKLGLVPLGPAACFASAICWCGFGFGRHVAKIGWVYVAVYAAWTAAFYAAVYASNSASNAGVLPGLAGGFVGSVLTFAAVAAITPELRRIWTLCACSAAGALAGLALDTKSQNDPMFWLFIVWQTAVLVCLAVPMRTRER